MKAFSIAVMALFSSALVGCGTTGSICSPSSCNGCCGADGQCVSITTDQACGSRGATCQRCLLGQSCQLGTCMFSSGSSGGGFSGTGGGLSGTGGGVSGTGGGLSGTGGGVSGTGGGLSGTGGGVSGTGGGVSGTGGGVSGTGGGVSGTGGGSGDTTAPSVVTFTYTPSSISTGTSAATVTVNARLTDVGSGLSQATFRFTSPSRSQSQSATLFSSERVSGNAQDGTYADTITFPQFSEPGTWELSANLYDAVGNSRSLSAAQLQALGISTSLTVTGTGDTTPPSVVSFTYTPSSISTASSAAMVMVSARLTDVGSGLSQATFRFTSPSRSQSQSATLFSSERVSGNAQDGTYADTITFPQFSEPGTWELSANLYDAVGNSRSLSAAQLQALGISTSLTVTGTGDTTAPNVVSFTFTPSTISTVSSAAMVTVSARLTDVGSGLSQATFRFTSPSRSQSQSATLFSSERVSGNAQDGTYADTITFPQFSEPGTWELSANLYDAVGNSRSLSAAQLQALGIATTLTVAP